MMTMTVAWNRSRRVIAGEFGPVPSEASIAPWATRLHALWAETSEEFEEVKKYVNFVQGHIDILLQLPKHEQANFKSLGRVFEEPHRQLARCFIKLFQAIN